MKLNLDFSLYKGTTRLRVWWKEVKKHFEEVQKAHNDLEDTHARDKEELLRLQEEEKTQRQQADEQLSADIDAAKDKLSADINAAKTELSNAITAEASARSNEDARLDGEISKLQAASHTHKNFEVLEGITAESVDKWNSSANEKLENTAFLDYLDSICADMSIKIGELYQLCGVEVYDGGLFGEAYKGASLNGGDDEDTEGNIVDFGSFDDVMPGEATIDGGQYA